MSSISRSACLLLFIYSGQLLADKYSGDDCYLKNGQIGICRNISECQSALDDFKKGIYPTQCAFEGETPIICCQPPVTTTQRPTLAPRIDKSGTDRVAAQKCREYSQFVIRKVNEIGLSLENRDKFEDTCKLESGSGFIVGGVDAQLEEFPHAAAIGYGPRTNIAWRCTGSLISNQWVLTAAHCIAVKTLGYANFVRVGFVTFQTDKGKTIPIVERIRHPGYRRNSYYDDISLLKLESQVEFSSSLRPACLRYTPRIEEKKALAIGWGLTDWRIQKGSDILQKVNLTIYDKATCDYVFLGDPKLKNKFNETSQLCIGELEGKKDTCSGDSGGPINLNNKDVYCMHDIAGITAAGSRFCGSANSTGLYTRVYNYLDWIERTVWPESFT